MMRYSTLKRAGRLSPVSFKRKKALAEYYRRRLGFLERHRLCDAGPLLRQSRASDIAQLPRCTKYATQVHHMARRGPFLNDESTWCPICSNCHRFVETHANIAREIGLLR